MGTAYKAAIPGATVTVSLEAPCRGGAGAPGSSPREACVIVCLAVLEVIPIRPRAPGAEHHARWQAGWKSAPAAATLRPHPQSHGSRAGSSTRILPAEYAPVTHRNAGVAGGAQINPFGVASMVMPRPAPVSGRRRLAPGIRAFTRWPAALAVMPADRLMPSRDPPLPAGLRMQAAAPSSGPARRPRRGLRSGHPAETGRHRVRRAG